MVPSKSNRNHNNIYNNDIPYPQPLDKEPSKDQNFYKITQLKDVQELHQQNVNNYKKGNICELVYSEEEYNENDRFISYDKLYDLINVKEPYDRNNYKNFKYKNYNKDNELLFSSDFESGNLRYAIKLNSNEYDLILRPETDCIRTYHWFFFRVKINKLTNSDKLNHNKIVKFNIINLYKRTVLFSERTKILSYYNNGWSRDTFNIHYFINGMPYQIENNINGNGNPNAAESNVQTNNDIHISNFNNTKSNIINSFNTTKTFNNINTTNINTTTVTSNINISSFLNNHNSGKNTAPNNDNNNNNNQNGMKYHTLSFCFDFSKITTNEKYVYFAYCYPYSFSQLDSFLNSLNHKDILRFDEVGKSIEGNPLHMLLITNFNDSFDELAEKQAVIFTSRVHPGESNGSYVIQGVIEFLLSNDPVAKNLRKKYIFKIIPMLNPDGVTRGNFRMNILGKDLNRMWDDPNENTSPTIFNTIKMINKTLGCREIYFFCDFHGHSNKYNFFLYSCKSKSEYVHLDEKISIQNPQKNKLTFYELVFETLLNKENPFLDRFSCTNKIIPSKTKTARAILKTNFNIEFSYCLETSIGAMRTKEGNIFPYTINQYKKIGRDFCVSLNKLSEPKLFFSVLSTIRFSKNEKCSLYSKNRAKEKNLILPNIHNLNNATNNNIHYSVSGVSNMAKNKKQNNNKSNNNKNLINNKINNYFHKLNRNINNNGANMNNKINNITNNKFSGITNSASNKSHSFKYNNKLRKSFEMAKHA